MNTQNELYKKAISNAGIELKEEDGRRIFYIDVGDMEMEYAAQIVASINHYIHECKEEIQTTGTLET